MGACCAQERPRLPGDASPEMAPAIAAAEVAEGSLSAGEKINLLKTQGKAQPPPSAGRLAQNHNAAKPELTPEAPQDVAPVLVAAAAEQPPPAPAPAPPAASDSAAPAPQVAAGAEKTPAEAERPVEDAAEGSVATRAAPRPSSASGKKLELNSGDEEDDDGEFFEF
eukprot:TRINITY_DN82607_c0_g1_i1.p1 TRINITY_DN82607_c0_g1~~TRINITY_DN82607_c0_g1_i1.p1  ORF type:complete len:167 (-),score=57.50 TRINITY_DN82607_c0_g1_i1:145-645(-)